MICVKENKSGVTGVAFFFFVIKGKKKINWISFLSKVLFLYINIMTLFIRQFRAFVNVSKKNTSDHKKMEQSNRRKSLTVKISKEPPAIVYFERDKLEDSFECIFDPKVHHDEEKDHPDLFENKKEMKPWQKPPYCSESNKSFISTANLIGKIKLSFSNNKTTVHV